MLRRILLALLLALPMIGEAQELMYANQFGTLANGLAADETGTYLTVDSTRQVFPAPGLFNRALTLRKFNNATGAEEWSRDLFFRADAPLPPTPRVALDAGGVYVSLAVNDVGFQRKAEVRKFGRDGTPLWTASLSNSTDEAVNDIAVANGVVYAVAFNNNNQGMLYGVNAETGTILFGTPVETGGFIIGRVVANGSGVYLTYGISPAILAKFSHGGLLEWERELLPTALSADALFAHGTGIYAGGFSFSGQRGYLARFDPEGNRVLELVIEPTQPVIDFVEIRTVTADSSGFYVGGRFRGLLDGQGTNLPNVPSAYVQKYSFDGELRWTKVIDEGTGTIFQWAGMAAVQGGLQIAGRSEGTFPGNPEDTGARALLARLLLPADPLPSISDILNQLHVAPANGLRGRISGICSQLDGFRRDVQRMRGSQLPLAEAELLLARVGDAQEILGCGQ